MSVRTPGGEAPLLSARRLLVLIFCGCLFGGGAQPREKACSPSRIARHEAERLLAVVPKALNAEHAGGRVALVRWDPGPSYRADMYYFYQLLSTATPTTSLDNGMIGYFGVNKSTGEVVELNSATPHVEGTALKQAQLKLRSRHCIDQELVGRNSDLPLER